MPSDFIDDLINGDVIEAVHVNQFGTPVNNLESGAAWYREATNTGNAYKVGFATDNAVSAYTKGLMVHFKASGDNTGAATLTITGSGGDLDPIALTKKGGVPLEDGDIKSGQVIAAIYNEDAEATNKRFEVLGGLRGLSSPVPISEGGTGADTATNARDNLGAQAQDDALDEISTLEMAKGDLFVHDGTEVAKLSPGSNGQVLSADSAESTGLKWVAASGGGGGGASDLDDLTDVAITTPASGQVLRYDGTNFVNAAVSISDVTDLQDEIDDKQSKDDALDEISALAMTKGDILIHDGTEVTKLSPGANGQVLSADSAESTGLKWVAASSGGGGGGPVALNDLTDVGIASPVSGQVVKYDGTNFVNATVGISDVTNLQDEIDDKQDVLTGTSDVPGLDTALAGKANASHAHSASDITSGTLPVARGGTGATTSAGALTSLGAAPASHTHSIADVTSLTSSLAAKQETTAKGIANGYAGLDATGKVPASQLPAGSGGVPTGTANKVAYFDNSGNLASTSTLAYTTSNSRMGVGEANPGSTMAVNSPTMTAIDGTTGLRVSRASTYHVAMETGLLGDSYVGTLFDGAFSLRTTNTPRFTLNGSGQCTLFPPIVGGQKLSLSGYSGVVTGDGSKGVEIDNSGYKVRLESDYGNGSYVGTVAAANFHLRTGNIPRFSLDSYGQCILFPPIVGGQKLSLSGYSGVITGDGSKGIEIDNSGFKVRLESDYGQNSYVGTVAAVGFGSVSKVGVSPGSGTYKSIDLKPLDLECDGQEHAWTHRPPVHA